MINICGKRDALGHQLSITCYLIDEHGIVVLTNSDLYAIVGQPLYKSNPWLMMQLEIDGLYDLIVTGNKLQDCSSRPPTIISSAPSLTNFIRFLSKMVYFLIHDTFNLFSQFVVTAQQQQQQQQQSESSQNPQETVVVKSVNEQKSELSELEWRIKNSHCFYFGIYSFNIYKWKSMDTGEIRKWCNGTRRYLAGYMKHSNLLMVAVENEPKTTKCGSIEVLAKQRPQTWTQRTKNNSTKLKSNANSNLFSTNNKTRRDYSINRYRKNPDYCHNYYPNESQVFFCKSHAIASNQFNLNSYLFLFLFIFINYYVSC
jgi:hypothetical protein